MYGQPPVVLGGGAVAGVGVSGAASSRGGGDLGSLAHHVGSLPFTGLSLLWTVIAAFSLLAAGLAVLSLAGPALSRRPRVSRSARVLPGTVVDRGRTARPR